MDQDFIWLDRFDGMNLTQWQDKLKFLQMILKIFYIFRSDLVLLPKPIEEGSNAIQAERQKYEDDEIICRYCIFDAQWDRLYDLYTNTTSAKEI